jgi:hypothetical protein
LQKQRPYKKFRRFQLSMRENAFIISRTGNNRQQTSRARNHRSVVTRKFAI